MLKRMICLLLKVHFVLFGAVRHLFFHSLNLPESKMRFAHKYRAVFRQSPWVGFKSVSIRVLGSALLSAAFGMEALVRVTLTRFKWVMLYSGV